MIDEVAEEQLADLRAEVAGLNAEKSVLCALMQARLRWPQLRLGQLLFNVVGTPADLYYMSDAQLATRLRDYAETPKGG